MASALDSPRPAPVLELEAEVVEAEVIQDGWDIPPAGVAVKKNPNGSPKYIPAD